MTIFRKTVVTLLVLTTLTIAGGLLTSLATAQTSRTTSSVEQLPITTSTVVSVAPGATFETGGVRVPPCPKATSFLATAGAGAVPAQRSGNIVSLPKWAVSVHVFQVTYNGSFWPLLTAFADGPQQASTSIPGGQPLSTDEDSNVTVRLLDNAAAVNTPFTVHVTGYCGVPCP